MLDVGGWEIDPQNSQHGKSFRLACMHAHTATRALIVDFICQVYPLVDRFSMLILFCYVLCFVMCWLLVFFGRCRKDFTKCSEVESTRYTLHMFWFGILICVLMIRRRFASSLMIRHCFDCADVLITLCTRFLLPCFLQRLFCGCMVHECA